tara:strand:+ start:73 stop:378 length:306 start_codon:yes stop_codon:yes gene_type:complete
MSILRITVRTFQNNDHANMFLLMSEKISQESSNLDLKFNVKIIQNPNQKNQITSIWEYDDEDHMKKVRAYLSKHNSIPNSLAPKEIVYFGEIKVSNQTKQN